MSGIKQLLQNFWFPALVLTWCGVTIWRSSRRLARLSAKESSIRRPDTHNLHTKAPFRRADFAAKADIVRKENLKGAVLVMVLMVGGPVSLITIHRRAPAVVPRGFVEPAVVILAAISLGLLMFFAARGSRFARRSGLICPACGMELAGPAGPRHRQYLIQDRILETGKCPGCKAQLLDPSEAGLPQTSTRAEQAAYIGVLAVLLAVLAVMTYSTRRMVQANAWARCRPLYDSAYTASDSVSIDSTTLGPRDGATCGYLRRSHDQRPATVARTHF